MSHLHVATDLSTLTGNYNIADVTVGGRVYRRLDPAYYAWLRRRVELASRKLDPAIYQALRARFMEIHRQAVDLFGVETLQDAAKSPEVKSYPAPGTQPPIQTSRPAAMPSPYVENYEFPKGEHPKLSFTQKVLRYALSEVDRIRDEALTAGWTEAELYQNRGQIRFPSGAFDYGIVCYVDPGQRLGQVTPEKIEVICRGGHSLYFRPKPGMRQNTPPGDPQSQPNPETREHAER